MTATTRAVRLGWTLAIVATPTQSPAARHRPARVLQLQQQQQ